MQGDKVILKKGLFQQQMQEWLFSKGWDGLIVESARLYQIRQVYDKNDTEHQFGTLKATFLLLT